MSRRFFLANLPVQQRGMGKLHILGVPIMQGHFDIVCKNTAMRCMTACTPTVMWRSQQLNDHISVAYSIISLFIGAKSHHVWWVKSVLEMLL